MAKKNLNEFDDYAYTPLSEPIPITEQKWPKDVLPLVCTRTLTYNHEPYIRECLDGILMQKTTFPVRVVIHEDASTDKTPEILRAYKNKYPSLIKVVYQPRNTYKLADKEEKWRLRQPYRDLQIGKYIAPCEGDDYWTDPLKLQKQLEFLETNPGFVMCYHAHKHRVGDTVSRKKTPKIGKDYSGDELIKTPSGIGTATKFFRNIYFLEKKSLIVFRGGDFRINSYLGMFGHCKYLSSINPSVRRIHDGGVWSSKTAMAKNYGVINVKIKVYNFFREIQDERRMNIALLALRDAVDQKMPLLDPKRNTFVMNKFETSFTFMGVRFLLYYKPLLLAVKKKWLGFLKKAATASFV